MTGSRHNETTPHLVDTMSVRHWLPMFLAGESLAQSVTDGPLLVAIGVALLAGFVSFASPCVLPLVPGYVSYVTGMTGATRAAEAPRWRVVAGAGLFVAGFTAVFTLIGATIGGAGTWLLINAPILEKVVGGAVIALGLGYLGLIPGLQREARMRWLPTSGLIGAPALGAVFALGWVPCVSPTLAAVQGLAFVEGGADRGVMLSIAYGLGLGVPFVLVALGLAWTSTVVGALRRHGNWVTRIGGVLLLVIGVLLVTGWWGDFTIWLRSVVGPGQIGI